MFGNTAQPEKFEICKNYPVENIITMYLYFLGGDKQTGYDVFTLTEHLENSKTF